jgi:hypothetical protein
MKFLDDKLVDEALMFTGKGIEYWFRFNQVVGKADLLNEDSIKFPVVEYLIADGDDSLKNLKLEDNHPVFLSREVDLISKTPCGKINYCIEFKLASKLTMTVQERQRIFDDIARLFFANNKKNVPTYLIIAGKTIDFLTEFRSITGKTPGKRGRKKKISDKQELNLVTPSGFYSDRWFSFDMSTPDIVIDIENETEDVYKKHYKDFKDNYLIEDYKDFDMPKKIKTKLKYTTEIKTEDTKGNVPAMVSIWEICADIKN